MKDTFKILQELFELGFVDESYHSSGVNSLEQVILEATYEPEYVLKILSRFSNFEAKQSVNNFGQFELLFIYKTVEIIVIFTV